MKSVFPILIGTLIIDSKGYRKEANSCLFGMLKYQWLSYSIIQTLSIFSFSPYLQCELIIENYFYFF